MKLEDSVPSIWHDFKNFNVNLPQNPDNVLLSEYGEDWRTPKSSKGDWGDDRFNLYPIFPFWGISLEGHIPNEVLEKKCLICKSELESLSSAMRQVVKERDDLLNSTIWKITRPVRWFVDLFK